MKWKSRFNQMVAAACESADCLRLDIRRPFEGAYLYYKPATPTAWGDIVAVRKADDAPTGYQPVIPNRIPADWPRGTIRVRLDTVFSRLPVIGPD